MEYLGGTVARGCRGSNWLEGYILTSGTFCSFCNFVTRLTFHSPSHVFRPDHEMNHAVRSRDEEAVEILAELLDFIASYHAVHF